MDDIGGPIEAAETGDGVGGPCGTVGEYRRPGLPGCEVGGEERADSAAGGEDPVFVSFFYDGGRVVGGEVALEREGCGEE